MNILSAYIVPHPPLAIPEVGRGDERAIQATIDGFNRISEDIKQLSPDTVIIISPHAPMYRDYIHISPGLKAEGSMAGFRAPQVRFMLDYDTELASAICEECEIFDFPAGRTNERDNSLDHGTMVPLYFILNKYKDFKLLRIGISGLPLSRHYEFGKILKEVLDRADKRYIIVASGDLAHCQKEDGPYGYRDAGPRYDKTLMDTLSSGNLKKLISFDESFLEDAMECGHRSFCIMAGALDGIKTDINILSHEATFGVGYGTAIIKPDNNQNVQKL